MIYQIHLFTITVQLRHHFLNNQMIFNEDYIPHYVLTANSNLKPYNRREWLFTDFEWELSTTWFARLCQTYGYAFFTTSEHSGKWMHAGKTLLYGKKNIGNIKNVIPNNSETVISISTNTYGLQKIAVNICLWYSWVLTHIVGITMQFLF